MGEHEHDVLIADLRTLDRTVRAPDAAERICLAVAANLPGDGAEAREVGTVGERLSGW